MKVITNYISISFLLACAVFWPFWLNNGYLDEWYPRIGSFIAIYGGLVANIIYVIKNRNN
jgi:hypothetical protein